MAVTKRELMNDKIAATVGEAFPFEVAKMPLFGPDNHRTPHFGLCRDDRTGEDAWCRVTVKKNYVPHSTEDVKHIASAAAYGFDVPLDEVDVSCSWRDGKGHRVSIKPSKAHRRNIYGKADNIFPQFIVSADYGGSLKADCGMFRDACKNMQMIRKVEGSSIRLCHTKDFRENFDATVSDFLHLAAKYDSVVEASRMLASRRVAMADFISELYPVDESDTKGKKTRNVKKVQSIITRLLRERESLGDQVGNDLKSVSLWEAVNAVTGYVQHDKRSSRNLGTDAESFLAVEDKESDAAWNLAFAMAS